MKEDNFNNEIPKSHSTYLPKNFKSSSINVGEEITENSSKPQNETNLPYDYSQKISSLNKNKDILNKKIKGISKEIIESEKHPFDRGFSFIYISYSIAYWCVVLLIFTSLSDDLMDFFGWIILTGWIFFGLYWILPPLIVAKFSVSFKHNSNRKVLKSNLENELISLEKEIQIIQIKEENKKKIILFSNKINNLKINIPELEIKSSNQLENIIQENKSNLVEKDFDHLHKIIRLSLFIKDKKENIISLRNGLQSFEQFENLLKISHQNKEKGYWIGNENINKISDLDISDGVRFFEEKIIFLKDYIKTYRLLNFQSTSMIKCFLNNDMINFYIIYESFDKLGVFDSSWEKDTKKLLKKVDNNILNLKESMNEMGEHIASEIAYLSSINGDIYNEIIK